MSARSFTDRRPRSRDQDTNPPAKGGPWADVPSRTEAHAEVSAGVTLVCSGQESEFWELHEQG